MMTRRSLTISSMMAALIGPAFAQPVDATGFVQQFGQQLIAVVNAPGDVAAKRQRLEPLIGEAVDTDAIAQFCLGRFARTATPAQMAEFRQVFHQVLLNNITGKLGDFQGVTFSMTNTTQREGDYYVGTLIKRPNQQPNNVQWVISSASGRPKVVDVVAEGTSLRQTQRSDYASFLSSHNNDVGALLGAMKRQVGA